MTTFFQKPSKLYAPLLFSLLLLSIFLAIAFSTPTSTPTLTPTPDKTGGFQPNPFLSPHEREKAFKKYQKMEANKLIQDPPPTAIQNGPPSDYKFDQDLPLTIGDVVPLNNDHLRPLLNDLTHTAYFRYYKVNMHAECPYWAMSRMCTSGGGCNVCECDEKEIPKPWHIASTDPVQIINQDEVFPSFDLGGYDLNDNEIKKKQLLSQWNTNVWSDAEKEQGEDHATYVNLLENIEGNTGYSGEEPRRIWDAIYTENCFALIGHSNVANMCMQDRLMYRLISGLHSSISAHVFKNWKLTEDWQFVHNQFLWNMLFTTQKDNLPRDELEMLELNAKNVDQNNQTSVALAMKYKKLVENDNKVLERINNLFFTLELLLESLSTLSDTPILPYSEDLSDLQINSSIIINTGDFEQDKKTAELLQRLIQVAYQRLELYTPATRSIIENSLALPSPTPLTLQSTFKTLGQDHIDVMRHLFHNVSTIMNCVGCEKCRIWSKLNILGIATGLKLASSQSTKTTQNIISSLKRNEIIAFINTVNSFSEAVHYINTLSHITQGLTQNDSQLKDTVEMGAIQESDSVKKATQDVQTETSTDLKKTTDTGDKDGKDEKSNSKKSPNKFLSGNEKILMILATIGMLSLMVYRVVFQPPATMAMLEQHLSGPKHQTTKDGKKIPHQQLQRLQLEEQRRQEQAALSGASNPLLQRAAAKKHQHELEQAALATTTSHKAQTQPLDLSSATVPASSPTNAVKKNKKID